MTINLGTPKPTELKPMITVIGVGGAGGNAVNNMIHSNLEGVEFIACNTDAQALSLNVAERKVQMGVSTTQGLGSGSKPEVGRAAAVEAHDEIMDHLQGSHMAFITAGMGGGTGTGAAPVIAQAARDAGILTVGVITKPFEFEGARRMAIAEAGIAELQNYVDTLIIIPNQHLFKVANDQTTFAEAFEKADEVLHAGVRGVTDLMVLPGLINLDFADVKSVMEEMGKAMMGTGESEGENRALMASEAAISNPLLEDTSMEGARGVLVNVTGGPDMKLFEVDEAVNRIKQEVDTNANIIFGSTFNETLEGKMRVSIVATGIEVAADAVRPPHLQVVAATATATDDGQADQAAAKSETPAAATGGLNLGLSASVDTFAIPAAPAFAAATAQPRPGSAGAPAHDAAPSGGSPLAPVTMSGGGMATALKMEPPMEAPFIAPPPVEATPSPEPTAPPDPFAVAAVVNGAQPPASPTPSLLERMTGLGRKRKAAHLAKEKARDEELDKAIEDARDSVQDEPAGEEEPALSADASPAERLGAKVKAETGAPPPAPAASAKPSSELQISPEGRMAAEAPENSLLEIPAFLRRQEN